MSLSEGTSDSYVSSEGETRAVQHTGPYSHPREPNPALREPSLTACSQLGPSPHSQLSTDLTAWTNPHNGTLIQDLTEARFSGTSDASTLVLAGCHSHSGPEHRPRRRGSHTSPGLPGCCPAAIRWHPNEPGVSCGRALKGLGWFGGSAQFGDLWPGLIALV